MTDVEWTPKAIDLLDGLETEPQERLVRKLDEAKDCLIVWKSSVDIRTTSFAPATTERS